MGNKATSTKQPNTTQSKVSQPNTSNIADASQYNNKMSEYKINNNQQQNNEKINFNVLCFNNGGHIVIDNKYINELFLDKSFTLECWALSHINLVQSKHNIILFGQICILVYLIMMILV